MGKRYVFWRDPRGKPYEKDDGRHALTALLEKIGELASVTPEDKITWPIESYPYQLAVRSAVAIIDESGNELNESDVRRIVAEAIKRLILKQGGGRAVPAKDFLDVADELAAQHCREPVVDYVLVTRLSVERLPAERLRINGCEVSAISERARKYHPPEALEMRMSHDPVAKHRESTEYLAVRTKTKGRSINEAAYKALDAVHLLRGLWTLFATHGSWRITGGWTTDEPIGPIHTGPAHTLHKPDGSPAADMFWFQPHYAGDRELFKPSRGWEEIEKRRRWAVGKMKQHGYRRDVEQLIINYAEALDHSNLDVAFLHMWSILERITDTVGANYDKTIDRATWRAQDRKIAKELLGPVRFRRNQYVHAAKSPEERDQVAYMVKSFVDPHLLGLIDNDLHAKSLREYGEFLDLPTHCDSLKRRRDQLARAIELRKLWSRRADAR